MNAEAVGRAVQRIAHEVLERARAQGSLEKLAFVGIRRGGVPLAERIRAEIGKATGSPPPLGTLDIALYRDDLAQRGAAPVVGPTDVRFPLEGRTIVLADDVLYTGRTIRAALDEIVDFGRPRRVWLAVLVDRGGHELPIAADFVGARLEVADGQDVQVRLREDGKGEDVVLVTGRAP
jgi:pyrimidine operon attenuation protein/uracil phosphoribosyltransferase